MKRYRKIRKHSRSKATLIAMGQKYDHLCYEDRVKIEHWQNTGKSIRYMAKELGRSPNTISREISSTKLESTSRYSAKQASVRAYRKRYWARKQVNKVSSDISIRKYVDSKLDLKWSPGSIAGRAKLDLGITLSKDSIYRYISLHALQHKLYFKGKPRRKKAMYKRGLIGQRKWIEERILRDEVGHYELDFIVSPKSSGSRAVLLVAVDTVSKQTLIELLPNRTKSVLVKALKTMFDNLEVKTILTDNDIAFSGWRYLEQLLGAPFYFTHPYHSWEKGLVENTNKWIRHFIPKKTNLSLVTKQKIHQVQMYLNNRPREVLNFKTANEVYLSSLANQHNHQPNLTN